MKITGETIRPATPADLPRVAEIWYEDATGEAADAPPLAGVPSLYRHELQTRELFVAERDGRVVGFAALINRGDIAFLADLFVGRADQSSGVGTRLLHRVLPRDGRTCCTVSSDDPRALALYTRFGMRPRSPYLILLGRRDRLGLGALPPADVTVVAAAPDDPELLRWDTEIGGRPWPKDHAYWIGWRGGVPLWFVRRGEVVGYGYAQTRSDDLLADPETITLGPIGVRAADQAAACSGAAVAWARERADRIRIGLPGPQPALPRLLDAGFRIASVDTFCSTESERFIDIGRYVPSGGDLF